MDTNALKNYKGCCGHVLQSILIVVEHIAIIIINS